MNYQHFAEILGLGTPELIVILVILLVLFGGSKLPQLAKSIGSSMKELRKGVQDDAKDTATTGASRTKTDERAA
ncbi:MAG TPA: twin-arginine translocase TatA/TatE family subunit [Candidatus Saccharimonadales bacterium]|jgi:sec-independent protein translocase protein TatA|nr:twin-arginine translocase TatA/TatE family subunit [Candidatus Saccharimonadales bacterium]